MGILDYEGTIMTKCSPIVHYNGKDVFLVNVSVLGSDGVGKFCGFQFPQRHLSYCKGFTQTELDELLEHLVKKEDKLRHEAELLPPIPDDIPIEELGLI